jgi:hypothetical protein
VIAVGEPLGAVFDRHLQALLPGVRNKKVVDMKIFFLVFLQVGEARLEPLDNGG